MDEKEIQELIAEIRRDIVCAINRKDVQSYSDYMHELYTAAGEVDEETQKDIGAFVFLINQTIHEMGLIK